MSEGASQGTLFNPPAAKADPLGLGFDQHYGQPLAHRDDEISSYRAGERELKAGRIRNQTAKVLAAVRELQGQTSWEIAVRIGCDRHMPARRLSALVHRGLVRRGPLKRCSVCKTLCISWWSQ